MDHRHRGRLAGPVRRWCFGWGQRQTPALTQVKVDFLGQHSGVRENREALLAARLKSAADAELLDKQSLTVEGAAK